MTLPGARPGPGSPGRRGPARFGASDRLLHRLIDLVDLSRSRHLDQPALGAVVIHQRGGLLAIDLQTLAHRRLLVVGALDQLRARMVVAVTAVAGRRRFQVVRPLANRALAPLA